MLVFIEEAHEFLSLQRIKDMPVLFRQVIASQISMVEEAGVRRIMPLT